MSVVHANEHHLEIRLTLIATFKIRVQNACKIVVEDEICRRGALVISREQGWRRDAGFAVPMLMS